jgi:hypothetical protein
MDPCNVVELLPEINDVDFFDLFDLFGIETYRLFGIETYRLRCVSERSLFYRSGDQISRLG